MLVASLCKVLWGLVEKSQTGVSRGGGDERLKLSGMLRSVDCCLFTDVSKSCSSYVFGIKMAVLTVL